MNNILIALGVFVVAVIAAAFAAPHVVDWNRYRGAIEEEVSRTLGRDVRIGGNLAFTLLPTPGFTLDRVRVAEAVSGSGEPAFRAEQLAVKLSVAPLLRGVLEAHEIEIRKARMRVPLTGFGLSRAQLRSDTFQFPIEIQDVALQAVRLTDSEIVIHRGDGMAVATLSGLDGEFAASTLEGPYRFRGTFGEAGDRLELRIATQRTDTDGSIRFKAGLKQVGGRGALALDGRLADPRQAIRVDGELTGELPLPRSPGMPSDVAEIRSPLTADADGLQLAGLSLVFEQQGRPQILSGNARVAWRSAVDISGDLSARWLDLDRIIGLEGKGSPLPALVAFLTSSTSLSRAGGRTSLNLSIDQANLGGEAVSGVVVRMSGDNGAIAVEEMGVGLPGGTRAEVTGAITRGDRAPAFRGSMALQGASLSRFLSWAVGDPRTFVGVAEGAFWLRTAIDLSSTGLHAADMTGRALDVPLWGDVHWRWERERTLSVAINGQQLNATSLLGEETSFVRVLEGLPGALGRLGIARDTRVEMLLRADEVRSARVTLTNVVTEAAVSADTVTLRRLQFSLPEGATAEIEGDFGRDGGAAAFRGAASVRSSAALDALAGIVGQGWLAAMPKSRREALLPMEIAGKARLSREGTPLALEIDGTVAGQPIVATLAASVPAGEGAANYDVSIDVLGADEASLLRFAGLSQRVATDSTPTGAPAATLRIRAAGSMREGMHAVAAWDALKSRATFQGLVKGDPGAFEASGLVVVAGHLDGALFTPLKPYLDAHAASAQSPLEGSARVTLKGATFAAEQILVRKDATRLSGSLSIERDADLTRFLGRLEAETLDLGAVIAPAITRDSELTAAVSVTSGRAGPWPEKPFDFSRLSGVSGTIELSARRLSFVDGLGLSDARLVLGVAPGRIEMRDVSGRGLSGIWSGNVRIEQVPGGGEIAGSIMVKGARVDGSDGASGAKAGGVADATATFSGRGIGVRGALSALAGRGSVDIGGARIAQLSPRQVTQAVEAALRGPADAVTTNLRANLQRAPAGVDVTARGLGFEIIEGVARLKPFAVDGADGRIEGAARLDLATMTTDIEWRIEARQPAPVVQQQPAVQSPAPARQPRRLPPITVTISGPIAALGRAEASISMDALERELVVRKMERDLEELERLRKLDEERAREETERRRLLEQGQQNAPQLPLAEPTGATAAGAQPGQVPLADPTITPTPLADTIAPPQSQPRQRRTAPAPGAPRPPVELRGGG